jgi:isochorismate synthase
LSFTTYGIGFAKKINRLNNTWVKYRLPNDNKVFKFSGIEQLNIPLRNLKKIDYFVYSLFEIPFGIHGFKLHPYNDENIELPFENYDGKEETKEAYIKRVESAIQLIKNNKFNKIVYSRYKFIPSTAQPLTIFESLCDNFSNAFVYLLNSPEFGMWCGASPEILIQEKNNSWQTMALAGTRLIEETDESWGKKDSIEQNVVVNEIKMQLEKLGLNFLQGELHTKISGAIAHLCTEFKINPKANENIVDLIKELHPTPAVCGLPRNMAFERIKNVENNSRELYTGIIGNLQEKNNKNIFVNLRCMRFFKNGIRIHAGGGIDSLSIAQTEWDETELKINSILHKLNV